MTSPATITGRALLAAACAAVFASSAAAAASPAIHRAPTHVQKVPSTRLLATFHPRGGVFAESLAIDRHGAMFVSKTTWGTVANRGQLVRVSPAGARHLYGPRIDLGPTSLLTGVAVSDRGRVYVARADFGAGSSLIYRVRSHRISVAATLPAGSFPNGLALRAGRLYVTDSANGVVWRFRPAAAPRHLAKPWLQSPLFAPTTSETLGANGLAFWHDTLFVVNGSTGALMRVRHIGDASPVAVLVRRTHRLLTADGLAVDRAGDLWVVGNGVATVSSTFQLPHGQFLAVLSRGGTILDRTVDARWMNYPTAVAPGRTTKTADRMYVVDGAFYGGPATLRSFAVH